MIDIKDDFLPEEIIHDLEWVIMGQNFAWFLQNKWGADEAEKINGYTKTNNYLQHNFWSKGWYSDRYNDVCRAWVDMYIRPTAIIRVKGNLYPKTEKIKEHGFDADFDYKHKNCMTSIICINTNNGYTKFENGKIVESIRNRLVTFPAHLKHTSSTCTDEEYRCIINLNYYK